MDGVVVNFFLIFQFIKLSVDPRIREVQYINIYFMTNEEEIEIINKRKNGARLTQIMNEYSIKSPKTIYDIIKRNGIKKVGNKKYIVDENYFSIIDSEEKAYWLGFLYADGYVRLKNNRSGQLKFKLSIKDRNHIELFNSCMNSNYKIKDYTSSVKYNGGFSKSNVSELSIYNTKIVKDLIRLGCVNKKTFSIRMPDIEKSLYRHFIRGYFDGDGNIYKNKNRSNSFQVSIASNFEFNSDIKGILGYGRIYKNGNIHLLIFSKLDEVLDFYNYIYDNASIYLLRKKQIFEKIKI